MFLHHLIIHIFTVIMCLYHRCDWLWLFVKHLLNLEAYWIILETNHVLWLAQSSVSCNVISKCQALLLNIAVYVTRLRLFPPWINRYLKVRSGNSRMQQLTRGTWSLGFPAAQPGCCRHSCHRGGHHPWFHLGSICFHVFSFSINTVTQAAYMTFVQHFNLGVLTSFFCCVPTFTV